MIQIPIADIIQAFLAISVRLSGLMLFAPFLGSIVIPARVKAGLVFALTVLLYPMISRTMAPLPMSQWPLLVFRELILGVAFGIATSVVFEGVQMAGQVLSVQMGYSLVNILDPTTQVDTTVVAMFQQSIAMLIFLRLDVHLWLLRALGNSFTYLPAGTAHLTQPFTMSMSCTPRSSIGPICFATSFLIRLAMPIDSFTSHDRKRWRTPAKQSKRHQSDKRRPANRARLLARVSCPMFSRLRVQWGRWPWFLRGR